MLKYAPRFVKECSPYTKLRVFKRKRTWTRNKLNCRYVRYRVVRIRKCIRGNFIAKLYVHSLQNALFQLLYNNVFYNIILLCRALSRLKLLLVTISHNLSIHIYGDYDSKPVVWYNNRVHIATSKLVKLTRNNYKLPHVFWHLLFKNSFFKAFVNSLIHSGKKEKVELLLFKLLCSLKSKTKNQPIFFMNNLFQTLQPVVETFTISVSGRSYPVPKVVLSNRRLAFFVRIMKTVTDRQKKKFCFNSRFLYELISASSSAGLVYSKILEMHRFSFDNRINMRFIRRRKKKRRVFI